MASSPTQIGFLCTMVSKQPERSHLPVLSSERRSLAAYSRQALFLDFTQTDITHTEILVYASCQNLLSVVGEDDISWGRDHAVGQGYRKKRTLGGCFYMFLINFESGMLGFVHLPRHCSRRHQRGPNGQRGQVMNWLLQV